MLKLVRLILNIGIIIVHLVIVDPFKGPALRKVFRRFPALMFKTSHHLSQLLWWCFVSNQKFQSCPPAPHLLPSIIIIINFISIIIILTSCPVGESSLS